MPLVVPGITTAGDQQTEWMNKGGGKKINESNTDATNFAKRDLPKEHRVIEKGSIVTKDFKADR